LPSAKKPEMEVNRSHHFFSSRLNLKSTINSSNFETSLNHRSSESNRDFN
jgi:hypothetical protein